MDQDKVKISNTTEKSVRDNEISMYLIECIRLGSWKVLRLNQALQLPLLLIPWLLLLRHRNYRKSYYDDYSRDKEYYAKERSKTVKKGAAFDLTRYQMRKSWKNFSVPRIRQRKKGKLFN